MIKLWSIQEASKYHIRDRSGEGVKNAGDEDSDIKVIFEPDLEEEKERAMRMSEESIPSRENKMLKAGVRLMCEKITKNVSLAGAEPEGRH